MPASLFYREGDHQGLQLINLENGYLEVSEEGCSVLTNRGETKKFNLVFIFGNARSGKSFMMNCLVGARGLFKVINSSLPCTKGVDISSLIVPQADLANRVNGFSDEQVPLSEDIELGFVDVEGQGDRDITYDTMLALPLLLTSKIVLFNHKGAPHVSDMLSKLGVLARAAEYIELGADDQVESNSSPPERKKFGHLHVIFRDFSFEGDREIVYEQLMGKEQVTKTKTMKGGGTDPTKAAKERNNIRKLLKENFESVNVWLFKQPATSDELRQHAELPEEVIDNEFKETIRGLQHTITEHCSEPTFFNGTPLTGAMTGSLIRQVAESLNNGGCVSVPSVFRAMEKETVARITAKVLKEFNTVAQNTRENMPLTVSQLQEITTSALSTMVSNFDDELSDCLLDDEKKVRRAEIELKAQQTIAEITRENKDGLLMKVKSIIDVSYAKMREDFGKYCDEVIPTEDVTMMQQEFTEHNKVAVDRIHEEMKGIEEAKTLSEFEITMQENKESIQEFLMLKLSLNQNALKDATIEALQEQAIQQQQMLLNQNKTLEKYVQSERANVQSMEKQLKEMEAAKKAEAARSAETQQKLQEQQAELDKLRRRRIFNICAFL